MVRIHLVLIFLMAITTVILVNEVHSYPFNSKPVCVLRSNGRRGSNQQYILKCPPCYICKDDSCQFSSCKPPYDFEKKMAFCVPLGKDRRVVRCARLKKNNYEDGPLRVEKSWKLPLRDDSSVSGVGIEVDQVKNAFIGLIDSQQIRFLIYNADTELVADLDLGSIDKKYSNRNVDVIRSGDELCLVEVLDLTDTQNNPHTFKCINPSKYVNATW